jgi:ribonuclease E
VRDDGRPADAYAWVHAHPSRHPNPSEDPYAWRDPHAPSATREDRLIETRAERVIAPAATAPAEVSAALPGPQTVVEAGGDAEPYVWAATPEDGGEEVVTGRRRERVRRGRGRRGRGTERGGEADVALADEDVEVPSPEVEHVELAPEAEAPFEAAPEPVVEAPVIAAVEAPVVAPEPQPEPEPDPNEITTPPATPRRGWWRRGG